MRKDVVFVFEVLNLLRFRLEIDGIMNALSMDGQIIKWRIPLVFPKPNFKPFGLY